MISVPIPSFLWIITILYYTLSKVMTIGTDASQFENPFSYCVNINIVLYTNKHTVVFKTNLIYHHMQNNFLICLCMPILPTPIKRFNAVECQAHLLEKWCRYSDGIQVESSKWPFNNISSLSSLNSTAYKILKVPKETII